MHQYKGKMIIHTGSMFSGKTSNLWSDLNRFIIAKYKIAVFKPNMDTRYNDNKIVTHDNKDMDAINITDIVEILEYVDTNHVDVIGIDEIQFIKDNGKQLHSIVRQLLEKGKTLVIAGLDMDYQARPFEMIKELMPIADYVYKHHAVCAECGVEAWVSHRILEVDDRIIIGSTEAYEPLCRACYQQKERVKEINRYQMKIE